MKDARHDSTEPSNSLVGMPPGRRADHAASTRRALLDAARALFAERGYVGTSLEDVVSAAGVTKGAVYHHFENKKELFLAVVELVEERVLEFISSGPITVRDAWEGLVAGIDRYLDACLEPEVQQILLLDAPTVLGWEHWRALEERYGLGLTRSALEVAMDAGLMRKAPVDPLAHLVLGALTEGSMFIARAEDRNKARREVGESVRTMLEGMRT
jgi:AcrR family transcriptional regulator